MSTHGKVIQSNAGSEAARDVVCEESATGNRITGYYGPRVLKSSAGWASVSKQDEVGNMQSFCSAYCSLPTAYSILSHHDAGKGSAYLSKALKAVGGKQVVYIGKDRLHTPAQRPVFRVSCQRVQPQNSVNPA